MKFAIGYQHNEALKESVLQHHETVSEIYFPWTGFTTGRGIPDDFIDSEVLRADLTEYAKAGFSTNLLLNGNCYGRYSLNRNFYRKIGDTVELLCQEYRLGAVTTTSPVIARFIKNNFAALDVRASVNMEICNIEGASYLLDIFDSFYGKRELNYNSEYLQSMYDFLHANGKLFFLLANSGCLNFCPTRTFHDNLVAHQHEIAEMDNAFEFQGLCHEFLHMPEHSAALLKHTNFIRPEDITLYENFCDGMKLATRTNCNPGAIIEAYMQGHTSGNLLELTEPAHAGQFYPAIWDSARFPADYAMHRRECTRNCNECTYCENVQKQITVTLNAIGEEIQC
ncbi:MAG: hypothetical protein LBM70_01360 [Victivallales bacterium]|jgi:hypothetical protein|nr:hypothetical protein [Victivallales bacterium]